MNILKLQLYGGIVVLRLFLPSENSIKFVNPVTVNVYLREIQIKFDIETDYNNMFFVYAFK